MASYDVVNYSLRPSKGIQRQIVFEDIARLQQCLDLDRLLYIGFGSIWFSDFTLAHKMLGIDDMRSIEANEVGYQRAIFNLPYATVKVLPGTSTEVMPALCEDDSLNCRPWLVWLDYDYEYNESIQNDVLLIVEKAPVNSILLITFNGHEMKYGKAEDRPGRLRELFGDVVPDELSKRACKEEKMQQSLADFSLSYMRSSASEFGRPGGFVPAFRILYRDGAPMITVGGVLPAKGAATVTRNLVEGPSWKSKPARAIEAPNLTMREAFLLQSKLPCSEALTREDIRRLGFDLEDEQIRTFQDYYKQFPAFAQIVA